MGVNPYRIEPCPPPTVYTGTRSFTARCTGGKVGDPVTKTATAESCVSQAHADRLAHDEACRQAEAALVCQWRAEASAIGSCSHTVVTEAFSTISYLDALEKAQARAPIEAENWCSLYGTEPYDFTSTQSFTINCDIPGMVGSHTETRTAMSNVSQDDADAMALAWATEDCNAYVLANGRCFAAEYVSTQSTTITASCSEGFTGDPQTRTATATVGSSVSQEEADAAAVAAATAAATSEANAALNCIEIVFRATHTATATCDGGFTGDPVTRTVTYTSHISLDDAEVQAAAQATAQANAALVCVPITYSATATVSVYCPDGYDGASSTATRDGSSIISPADAYALALAAAEAAANDALTCVPHVFTSSFDITVNCPEGSHGDPATTTGYGESIESQAAADAAAELDALGKATALLVCEPDE